MTLCTTIKRIEKDARNGASCTNCVTEKDVPMPQKGFQHWRLFIWPVFSALEVPNPTWKCFNSTNNEQKLSVNKKPKAQHYKIERIPVCKICAGSEVLVV